MIDFHYFNIEESDDICRFKKHLNSTKKYIDQNKLFPVFLCIGSDRATGDCFGPLVGEQLNIFFTSHVSKRKIAIYGSLKHPVHALNLSETIETIKKKHHRPYIIAIDASLGISEHVGFVSMHNGPLFPGIGVNKKLPQVGDTAITGIVNLSTGSCNSLLQTTRLSTVVELSSFVSEGIISTFSHIHSAL